MKKIIYPFFSLCLLFAGALILASNYVRGETMPYAKIEKRFGTALFNEDLFQKADETEKSKMAANLIKRKKEYLGTLAVTTLAKQFLPI